MRRRGWWLPIALYIVAFVLLVISTYLQFEGNTKSSLPLVWSGIGAACMAMLFAVASVLMPARA
jgi:hypothetical protein